MKRRGRSAVKKSFLIMRPMGVYIIKLGRFEKELALKDGVWGSR